MDDTAIRVARDGTPFGVQDQGLLSNEIPIPREYSGGSMSLIAAAGAYLRSTAKN